MTIKEEIANFCRIMRAEGKLHRFTPESDADEILSIIKSQNWKSPEEVEQMCQECRKPMVLKEEIAGGKVI